MASLFSSKPGNDPLDIFGRESNDRTTPTAPAVPVPAPPRPSAAEAPIAAEPKTKLDLRTVSAPANVTSSQPAAVAASASPPGSVSFDQVCAIKGLGFVEGVALIQATCEAVRAAGDGGVPDLHDLSLTAHGQVLLNGTPTGEPPARELARLLHQMVAPDLMPPAGRLFVGRWINNDSASLPEFASELAYFARPNSHELLVALHGRCAAQGVVATTRSIARREERKKDERRPKDQLAERPVERRTSVSAWLRAHKTEVGAAAIAVAAVFFTALGATLWTPGTVAASKQQTDSDAAADASATQATTGARSTSARTAAAAAARSRRDSSVASQRRDNSSPVAGDGRRDDADSASPTAANEASEPNAPVDAGPGSPLAATGLPDLKIYSSNDSGVEPPRLRSAEIPELLIAGFERRQNRIELVVSERGQVQQARMIGAPQRMPDIMLLSRAKELLFDPAVRNGVPVRYRLVLTWNVTP